MAYTITGFLEKNKDEVSADLKDFVAASIQKIPLGKLILDKDYSQSVVSAKGKKTVAGAVSILSWSFYIRFSFTCLYKS